MISRSRVMFFLAALVAVPVSGCGVAEVTTRQPSEVELRNGDYEGATTSKPFPMEDARTALRAAARGLRSCRVDPSPLSFDAHLRFEPSGKVGAVALSGADRAPNEITSCVRARLTEVALTRFDGEPVTVKMRVEL